MAKRPVRKGQTWLEKRYPRRTAVVEKVQGSDQIHLEVVDSGQSSLRTRGIIRRKKTKMRQDTLLRYWELIHDV